MSGTISGGYKTAEKPEAAEHNNRNTDNILNKIGSFSPKATAHFGVKAKAVGLGDEL